MTKILENDQNFSESMTNFLANERPKFWQMNDQFFGNQSGQNFGK